MALHGAYNPCHGLPAGSFYRKVHSVEYGRYSACDHRLLADRHDKAYEYLRHSKKRFICSRSGCGYRRLSAFATCPCTNTPRHQEPQLAPAHRRTHTAFHGSSRLDRPFVRLDRGLRFLCFLRAFSSGALTLACAGHGDWMERVSDQQYDHWPEKQHPSHAAGNQEPFFRFSQSQITSFQPLGRSLKSVAFLNPLAHHRTGPQVKHASLPHQHMCFHEPVTQLGRKNIQPVRHRQNPLRRR